MASSEAIIDQLRAVDLFRSLEEMALSRIVALVQTRSYDAGQMLFQRGDAADAMYFVTKGKIRLSVTSLDGRDLTLRYAGRGELFGEIALLDGGVRTADAAAFQPSSLLVIPRSRLDPVVAQEPAIAMAFVKGLCGRLRETTDQLESIALLGLEQRLARLFLNLAKATGSTARHVSLALDLSQGEIAMLVNASRPKVNQVLVAWHGSGLAVRTPPGLRLDTEKLQDLAESDNG